jgi:hypothetical protein
MDFVCDEYSVQAVADPDFGNGLRGSFNESYAPMEKGWACELLCIRPFAVLDQHGRTRKQSWYIKVS